MTSPEPGSVPSTDEGGRESRAVAGVTEREARRVTTGALIGNALEWYDFFLFSAAAALVFNIQYFSGARGAAARR
ncbi:hypothetical protein ACF3NT_05690 [Naumannella halotolerans]|uniref:hypothetical protein n=1 Tax=Naumannella halotolerans TaxID=993414 RepID=UPI001060B47B|nr:hypothetical protein [Naumannella halotolerans]